MQNRILRQRVAAPIMLADDDETEAFLTTRAFEQAGIQNRLIVVSNGQAAIEYLAGKDHFANREAHPLPCLLLLDQKLPDRSGLEVLEWVRSQSSVCTLPVLVLSASDSDGDVQAAYLVGANGYLVKPTKFDDMLAMARAIKEYWPRVNRGPSR
jgi:DNA-binding response OmpR family regulator